MIVGAIVAAARVFSADYCADQYVLALVDRDQIAALSVDAEKDFSYLRRDSVGLKQAGTSLEHVLAARADRALRFWGGDAARLQRTAPTTTLPYAADFGAVAETIRSAAAAVGEPQRGEALIARMTLRLEALRRRGESRVRALYVTPGGVTAGRGAFIDAIFAAAGVENAAGAKEGWPPLPAEIVLTAPPDLIVTGFFGAASERANNWSAARHPALKRLFARTPSVHLPADVIACPAWFGLDAAEMIRDAADALTERRDAP